MPLTRSALKKHRKESYETFDLRSSLSYSPPDTKH